MSSYVWHMEHGSMDQLNGTKQKIFNRSRDIFIKKWGKILRVAWVVNNYDEVVKNLEEAISLGRDGNYVWFFVKNLKKDAETIFSENKKDLFSDIKFTSYRTIFDLIWKIIIKKKKYDVIITDKNIFRKILNKIVQKTLNCSELNILKNKKRYFCS